MLGPFLRRRVLSADWARAEQTAGGGDDRQFHEQSVHSTNPPLLSLGEECGGHAAPIPSSRRYGIGFGPGTGGTPQISVAQGNCARFQVGMMVSLPWVDAV